MSRPELDGPPAGMGEGDAELLSTALALLGRVYRVGRHEVVAAFRMSDGAIVTGVHVDGTARRSSVCAEGAASGAAVAHAAGGRVGVVSVVSVLRRPAGTEHLIEPCGVCAELLSDYWPDARVWVTEGDDARAVLVRDLLPHKKVRES
jgi:cytidine deaminase